MNLTKEQAARMESFLEEMSQVLGRSVKVILESGAKNTGAFAFTDGKNGEIVIDPWKLDWNGLGPVRTWLQTKGLFYHEMMHCVADPVSDYSKVDVGLRRTVNALSDQTGEVRFANLYPGARTYFALNAYELLLHLRGSGQMHPHTYALVYGRRRFLPARLLRMARELMAKKLGPTNTAEVERIIDAYHTAASLGGIATVAVGTYERLAQELQAILGRELEGMDESIARGRLMQDARKADKNAAPVAAPGEAGKSDPESEPSGADEGGVEGQPTDGEPAESEGDSEEEGKRTPGESTPESAPGGGAGLGDESGDPADLDGALRDLVEKALDAATQDELHTAEREAGELKLGDAVGITSDAMQASTDLANLLKRVQVRMQAGYESGHRAGRLDLRRIRQNRSQSTDVFRQWQPDRRMETRLSVALVIDKSGSMRDRLHDCNQVARAVAMACERASPDMNRVMIRYFSSSEWLTKTPEATFDASSQLSEEPDGGTHPRTSIELSLAWLKGEKGAKVLLVLTDGEWAGWHPSVDGPSTMRDARAAGISVQVLYLDDPSPCETGLPQRTVPMSGLAQAVFELVQASMRARVQGVA